MNILGNDPTAVAVVGVHSIPAPGVDDGDASVIGASTGGGHATQALVTSDGDPPVISGVTVGRKRRDSTGSGKKCGPRTKSALVPPKASGVKLVVSRVGLGSRHPSRTRKVLNRSDTPQRM